MPTLIRASALLLAFTLLLFSCKEEKYSYELEDLEILLDGPEKDKEKTVQQFLSIMYANLYQTPLSPRKLVEMTDVVASIGDKKVAYETIVGKMMNDPLIQLPADSTMRNDPEAFIVETYNRFYVRKPTQAELNFFLNFIQSNPKVTTELVYFAFALSNEYYYY